MNIDTITNIIVKKRAKLKPKKRKILKVIRAPKSTMAHDAPSKKLIILSNISFCMMENMLTSAHQQLSHHQDKHK